MTLDLFVVLGIALAVGWIATRFSPLSGDLFRNELVSAAGAFGTLFIIAALGLRVHVGYEIVDGLWAEAMSALFGSIAALAAWHHLRPMLGL